MIKENISNSYNARWIKAHNPQKKHFEKRDLNKIKKDSLTLEMQAKYWQKLELYYSSYESVRRPLSNAYKEIMSHIFLNHIKEFDRVIEIGCGPHASYYNFLSGQEKSRWLMLDINESSVHISRSENKEGEFFISDFHRSPFKDNSFDIVAGFNAFETTRYLKATVEEACRILSPQGYLLAIQDVIPSDFAIVAEESEIQDKGITIGAAAKDESVPVLIATEYGDIDIRSYHIGKLQNVAENSGFYTVYNGIIESDGLYPETERHKVDNIRNNLNGKPFNSFVDIVAMPQFSYNPEIPEGYVRECTAANVFIGKKIS